MKKINILLLMLTLGFVTSNLNLIRSQNISTLWEVTVDDGSETEMAREICLHQDGGFVTVGDKEGIIMVVKSAADGTTTWKKSYLIGNIGSLPSAMKPTEDGGYIIVGQMVNPGNGNYYDACLLKLNENGDSVWSKTYSLFSDDNGNDVIQTSDGGYLLAGYSIDLCNDSLPAFIIKTDSAGNKLWSKTYRSSVNTQFNAIKQANGGYVIAGYKYTSNEFSDVYVLKIDDNGNTLWETTFGNQYNDAALCIKNLSDDNFIISGESRLENTLTGDVYIAKISGAGTVIWTKIFGGVHDDEVCSSIVPTSDGGYMGVGYRRIDPSFVTRVWLLKFNQNGDTLWTQYYGVANWSLGNSIINTSDNGYAFAGVSSKSESGGDWDFYMVRLNPETLYVNQNNSDANSLSATIFPNPFSNTTQIKIYLPSDGKVKITVSDFWGNPIIIADKYLTHGTHSLTFDASFLPSGIYFYTINANGQSLTKRMVISKQEK